VFVVDMAVTVAGTVAAAAGIVASAGIEGVAGTVVVFGNVADCNEADVGTVVGTVADNNTAAVVNFDFMVVAAADNTAGVVVDVDIAGKTVDGMERNNHTSKIIKIFSSLLHKNAILFRFA
jgi:hypothetical protein